MHLAAIVSRCHHRCSLLIFVFLFSGPEAARLASVAAQMLSCLLFYFDLGFLIFDVCSVPEAARLAGWLLQGFAALLFAVVNCLCLFILLFDFCSGPEAARLAGLAAPRL